MMQLNALQLGQTCKANLTISLWLVVMGQAWEFFFFDLQQQNAPQKIQLWKKISIQD